MRQPQSSVFPISAQAVEHDPPPGRRRERPNLTERVGLWRAFWLYLAVAWLAAGALIEQQPLTHVPGQVLELVQFAPSIAVLTVLARYRAAVLRIWQGTAVVMLRRIGATPRRRRTAPENRAGERPLLTKRRLLADLGALR